MSYKIGQYVHNPDSIIEFMTDKTNTITLKAFSDMNSSDNNFSSSVTFQNAGFLCSENYQAGQSYFVHCEIGALSTKQTFKIKLSSSGDKTKTQYIKTIVVQPGEVGNINSMVDVNFIFTPIETFDFLVFELERIDDDFTEGGMRIPHILFRELSLINNVLDKVSETGVKAFEKIGVQAKPGFKMCINHEEIKVGRTGIYEIKNGIIKINFFSAVVAAEFGYPSRLDSWREMALQDAYGKVVSQNNPHKVDSFILDYIYKESE